MIAMRIKAAVICKEVPMFITNEQDHAFRHGERKAHPIEMVEAIIKDVALKYGE